MRWDIFCKVIDNHGDLGVCWRLAAELAGRGESVRLWVDEPAALAFMAPRGAPRVEVLRWQEASAAHSPAQVVVEAFGCDPHEAYLVALAERTRREQRQPAWINLEYLSAEAWVERCHGLASPVLSGPAKGLTKKFFYPGFTPLTGGLIREQALATRQAAFDRAAWLRARSLPPEGERLISLFCYEPPVEPLLMQLARGEPTRLLVTEGRARAATGRAMRELDARQPGWNASGTLRTSFLPLMSQEQFDELLWTCDLNFVRGEDSLVRALWAGQPLVWQIYPQEDGVHRDKLDAFLDRLAAPPSLRAFHLAWNGFAPDLPPIDALSGWQRAAQAARARLLAQEDLVTQLMRMATGSCPRA
ncbi:elongation factor P maturation arginine rhamnosyltransferase EarP [Ramlibacter sp. AW1]|uniref:Protein-arginine rhamnosyltransferase n=1 Tax=Ramlibacter aurantiacus TaxID=2801330 RepID=A0A937D5W5_9BURK|nr:elongation factor P maturation arginine rhamnosyltransferase EarP [Ramlibacter aurantiacus]MBL0420338.1 elongation factor P maturation arginine rhamnosyltransferase EarP [Ramlibacter aurantiacus]